MATQRGTSPARIEIDERQIAALNLRKAGTTYQAIADELGYANPAGARAAVMAALDRARQEPADELRALMASRIDDMLAVAYERALEGDLFAIQTVQKLEDQRAKLFGVYRKDAPIKTDIPTLEKPEDAQAIVAALLDKAASGQLSPDDAARLASIVQGFLKVYESVELAKRVDALEAGHNV